MKYSISPLVKNVASSPTVDIADNARRLFCEGKDLVDLSIGDPDFQTPENVIRATEKALNEKQTHYVSSWGLVQLRQAIAEKLIAENNMQFDPENEIIVLPGGKPAVYLALQTCVQPGEEVLYFEPAWVSYEAMIRLIGGVPIPVSLSSSNNYELIKEEIFAKITSKTKAIVFNSPNNPTGRVYKKKELDILAEIALEYNLIIISDEVYDKIVFSEHQHISLGSYPEIKDRVLTVNAFSKSYAMTGWRLGYLAGRKEILSQTIKIAQHLFTCVSPFVQIGGVEALISSEMERDEMIKVYGKRKEVVYSAIKKIKGVSCNEPEGTFYLFPRVDFEGKNSLELATYLLEKALLVVTPGSAFGNAGEGHLRICLTNDMDTLIKGVERLREIVDFDFS